MTNSKIKEAFEKLNPPQQTSVREDNPRLLILAGAGKTSTLVFRVTRHLIKDKFLPHQIVGLTFTNKAGKEVTSHRLIRRCFLFR
ncbi:UvrD-helicase domain-containing protein [Vibrio hepatarius]|uniref:UvrD-helicase domain-containing protein n=1 Tax=Vibrio hepatarius TaxID=171383 RepID=UPI001C09B6FF|nr:UvrD-helicase domain-containing protein [Vibrio hepatarius]MBU2895930.1 UvrD-helicase domain-containing protein [Vibrio hepatarius]